MASNLPIQLPLESLLIQLETEGFQWTVDKQIRLQTLLQETGKDYYDRPEELKILLCPLLADTQQQQEKFYKVFDTYYRQHIQSVNPSVPHQKKKNFQKLWKPICLILFLFIVLSGGIYWINKPKPVYSVNNQDLRLGQEVIFLNHTALKNYFEFEWNLGDGTVLSTPRKVVTHTYKIPGKYLVQLKVTSPMGLSTVSKRVIRIGETKKQPESNFKDIIAEGETKQVTKEKDVNLDKNTVLSPLSQLLIKVENPGEIVLLTKNALLILAMAYLILWFYTEVLLFIYRNPPFFGKEKRALEALFGAGRKPPYQLQLPSQTNKINHSDDIREIGRLLRSRYQEASTRLHIQNTVKATVATGGFPKLFFTDTTKEPEYLILIDVPSQKNQQSNFLVYLSHILQQEDVSCVLFYYEKTLEKLWNVQTTQKITLKQLYSKYPTHRVLIFGEGTTLLEQPATRRQTLQLWETKALMTPLPPQNWAANEHALFQLLPVFPATLKGLGVLAHAIERNELPSLKEVKETSLPPQQIEKVADKPLHDFTNLNELKSYLGDDLFVWLCALTAHTELKWEITLAIGKELERHFAQASSTEENQDYLLVTDNNLLKLTALPWLQAGEIPQIFKQHLKKELEQMHEIKELAHKTVWETYDKSPAPSDSEAYQEKQVVMLTQQYFLHPKNIKIKRQLRYLWNNQLLDSYLQKGLNKRFGYQRIMSIYRLSIFAIIYLAFFISDRHINYQNSWFEEWGMTRISQVDSTGYFNNMGVDLYTKGETEGAITSFKIACQAEVDAELTKGNYKLPYQNIAWVYYRKGSKKYKDKKYKEALVYFDYIVKLDHSFLSEELLGKTKSAINICHRKISPSTNKIY